MLHYVVKESIQDAKVVLFAEDVSNIILFVLQLSTFLFEEVLTVSNKYLHIESQALL